MGHHKDTRSSKPLVIHPVMLFSLLGLCCIQLPVLVNAQDLSVPSSWRVCIGNHGPIRNSDANFLIPETQ